MKADVRLNRGQFLFDAVYGAGSTGLRWLQLTLLFSNECLERLVIELRSCRQRLREGPRSD